MDLLSVVGVLLGLVAILGGNFLEGGHLAGLYNGPAAVIVLGGTLGAALLQTPARTWKHMLLLLPWVLRPPLVELRATISQVVGWCKLSRRDGLLGLEGQIAKIKDDFTAKGIQLLVDGNDPDIIKSALEVELVIRENRDIEAARVLESMGGYAPTIGIIGAVMGLIHVMGNLSDPSKLGSGIATAFVATIYGVGLANLILIPMANKIKANALAVSQTRELIVEGIIAVANGENPRAVELRLIGYLDAKEQAPILKAIHREGGLR